MKQITLFLRFCLLCLPVLSAKGQSGFRFLDDSYSSTWMQSVLLEDSTIGVNLSDSLCFKKLTRCGVPLWTIKLRQEKLFNVGPNAFASDGAGGMVWVGHYQQPTYYAMVFLHILPGGGIKAMRQYVIPGHNLYPYSILKTPDNQFVVFGNISPVNDDPHRFLIKLDGDGQIISQFFGEGGGIWGGAEMLDNGKFITRAGNVFFLHNADLSPVWGFSIFVGGNVYEPPMPVNGGFVFPELDDDGHFGLYKIDTIVSTTFRISRRIDSVRRWYHNFMDENGGMYSLLERQTSHGVRPMLLHWDSDLRLLSSHIALFPELEGDLLPCEGLFSKIDNHLRLSGLYSSSNENIKKVWISNHTPEQVAQCWSPIALSIDTLPTWSIIGVLFNDRPNYTINNLPFGYRFFPEEHTPGSYVCGQSRSMQISLGKDTVTCGHQTIELHNRSQFSFDSYRWNTGATESNIQVSDTGTFWVQGLDACENIWLTDSIRIGAISIPTNPVSEPIPLCEETQIVLPTPPVGWKGHWEDDSLATTPRTVEKGGNYALHLEKPGCETRWNLTVEECESAEFPNLISSNADERNDAFLPTRFRKHKPGTLVVWNRWGKQVENLANFPLQPWKPTPRLSDGLYFWEFKSETDAGEARRYSGWVEVVKE